MAATQGNGTGEGRGSAAPIIIAGGGIGGLALGLTLHQLGLPFVVLEAAREMRPLGVGINLQPNAVRELFDLGIGADALDGIGLEAREWALLGRAGQEIYAEPRGREAGYRWPQYALHRGRLQMLLAETLRARAGAGVLRTGARVQGYEAREDSVAVRVSHRDGGEELLRGALLIGADGIHSAVRAQMYPDQPPIHWGGVVMWRGVTRARPLRGGASFVGLGGDRQRMVIYPISPPDPKTGLAEVNWIAEITENDPAARDRVGWFRPVPTSDFAQHFDDWVFDWLDVPALLRGTETAWENPMIDRDPVPSWVAGRVALMGDAAHAMYPTGSNGASQAIVDARELGAALVAQGVGPAALAAYDAKLCAPVSALVLRNREAGPFGLLKLVEARGGDAPGADLDALVPPAERAAFMAGYKAAAGLAVESLNAAPPLLPPTAGR